MTKTVAFIQARMSSSRFPGKILAELGGMPMIQFMLERVKRAKRVDQVVLVTSTDASDDPVAELMARTGIDCFRGSLDDVLGRFYHASRAYPADVYVRLTGDCPLIDPDVIDAVIAGHIATGSEYSCNTDPPTYADGLDVEVFAARALEQAHANAVLAYQREHVTQWMLSAESGFARYNLASIVNSADIRLTVDHGDDLDVVRAIVEALGAEPFDSDHFAILRFLDKNRSLLQGNPHTRNEGLSV